MNCGQWPLVAEALFTQPRPTPALQNCDSWLIFWPLHPKSNGMDSSSPNRHLGAKLVSDTTSKRKGGVTMKLKGDPPRRLLSKLHNGKQVETDVRETR